MLRGMKCWSASLRRDYDASIVRFRRKPPDILEVDAEGLDLQVLARASDILGHTEVVLEEALIVGGRENIIQRMNEAGYHILDITDLNRSPKYGVLWLCELAFLKNDSKLLDSVASYD